MHQAIPIGTVMMLTLMALLLAAGVSVPGF
jgi:hypothetical protein